MYLIKEEVVQIQEIQIVIYGNLKMKIQDNPVIMLPLYGKTQHYMLQKILQMIKIPIDNPENIILMEVNGCRIGPQIYENVLILLEIIEMMRLIMKILSVDVNVHIIKEMKQIMHSIKLVRTVLMSHRLDSVAVSFQIFKSNQ